MFRSFRDFLFRRVLWEVSQQAHDTRALLLAMEGRLMTAADDLNAKFDRMVAATNNIAADVRAIKASISTGMTQAEVDAAQARAESIASTLEALDAENPEGQASA